jgi:hypothetical protein
MLFVFFFKQHFLRNNSTVYRRVRVETTVVLFSQGHSYQRPADYLFVIFRLFSLITVVLFSQGHSYQRPANYIFVIFRLFSLITVVLFSQGHSYQRPANYPFAIFRLFSFIRPNFSCTEMVTY